MAQHPLRGHGFGSFRDLYARDKASEVGRFETLVHDLPLELLLATGVLGAASFLWLALSWARLGWAAIRRSWEGAAIAAASLTYGTCLLFNFDQPATSAWAWTLAGSLAISPEINVRLGGIARWSGLALAGALGASAF